MAPPPPVRIGPVIAGDVSTHDVEARLAEAAASGCTLEVIVVFRGKVRRSSRPGRWRMRLVDGGAATFVAGSVVAVTPSTSRSRR